MKNTYTTKDLGEAVALLSSGVKMNSIDWKERVAYFTFAGDCESLSREYFFGNLQVNARLFNDNMRSLKSRLVNGR